MYLKSKFYVHNIFINKYLKKLKMIQKKLKEVISRVSWKKYLPKGEVIIAINDEYLDFLKVKIQKQKHWLEQKSLLEIS